MGTVAGIFGIVAASVSLAAFFGSLWWLLDLVANFRPQHVLVLAVFTVLSLPGDRRLSVSIGLVLLLDVAVVAPHVVGSAPGIAPGSARIEVMTFNVGISNPNRREVAEFVAEEDPDVLFVFESSFEWENALRSADLDLQIVQIVPRDRLSGVTVLVRPELRPRVRESAIDGTNAAVEVDLGGERIVVLGLHPPSPTSARRASARDRILRQTADWVAQREVEVVLLGDLNATPWSHAFRSLRREAGVTDTMRGSGLQPTWPDGWGVLAIPIDHVLHTSGLGSADRRVGPAFESAHRPVIVTVGMAG